MSSAAHGTHLRRWALSLPPIEFAVQRLRELLIGALKCGPIPQHIAFVMDGNRRYARQRKLETVEGHHLGFEALAKILEVCYKSGVRVVTIYAFSIENFNRSKYEVDGLMDMAKTKLVQMSQHGALLDRYGASVRVIGDRSLLRQDVLEQVDKAVNMTAHNKDAILNVCFPYTGREEITHSIRETVREFSHPPPKRPDGPKRPFSETHIQRNIQDRKLEAVAEEEEAEPHDPAHLHPPPTDGAASSTSDADSADFSEPDSSNLNPESSQTSHSPSPVLRPTSNSTNLKDRSSHKLPDPESITAGTFNKNTYTGDCPPLDLLVRTSGVQRLSDFMLWQCHETTQIEFIDCLWPEFDLLRFMPVLLEWQWRQRRIQDGDAKLGAVKVA